MKQIARCIDAYHDLVMQHGGYITTTVDFSSTPLSDVDLARLDFPDSVQSINLSGTKITDAGLAHLARARNLQRLVLNFTAVTETGLETIKVMENVSDVELYNCPNISQEAKRELVRFLAPRGEAHQKARQQRAAGASAQQ